MSEEAAVKGALTICDGAASFHPCLFTITEDRRLQTEQDLQGVDTDALPENIEGDYGKCAMTGGPCEKAFLPKWFNAVETVFYTPAMQMDNFFETVIRQDQVRQLDAREPVVTVNQFAPTIPYGNDDLKKVLKYESILVCSNGGVVSFLKDGQEIQGYSVEELKDLAKRFVEFQNSPLFKEINDKLGINITPTLKFPTEWYVDENTVYNFQYLIKKAEGLSDAASQMDYSFKFFTQGFMQSSCDYMLNEYKQAGVDSTTLKNLQNYLTPELIMGVGNTESGWNTGTMGVGITKNYVGLFDMSVMSNVIGGSKNTNPNDYIDVNSSIYAASAYLAHGIYGGTKKGLSGDKLVYGALFQYGFGSVLDDNAAIDNGARGAFARYDDPYAESVKQEKHTSASSAHKLLMAQDYTRQRWGRDYIEGLDMDDLNNYTVNGKFVKEENVVERTKTTV